MMLLVLLHCLWCVFHHPVRGGSDYGTDSYGSACGTPRNYYGGVFRSTTPENFGCEVSYGSGSSPEPQLDKLETASQVDACSEGSGRHTLKKPSIHDRIPKHFSSSASDRGYSDDECSVCGESHADHNQDLILVRRCRHCAKKFKLTEFELNTQNAMTIPISKCTKLVLNTVGNWVKTQLEVDEQVPLPVEPNAEEVQEIIVDGSDGDVDEMKSQGDVLEDFSPFQDDKNDPDEPIDDEEEDEDFYEPEPQNPMSPARVRAAGRPIPFKVPSNPGLPQSVGSIDTSSQALTSEDSEYSYVAFPREV